MPGRTASPDRKLTTPIWPAELAKSIPQRLRAGFVELDHLGLKDHAVDGYVDRCDHLFHLCDVLGGAPVQWAHIWSPRIALHQRRCGGVPFAVLGVRPAN